MSIRTTNGHASIAQAVRAYRTEHPDHKAEKIALALGITRRQVDGVHQNEKRAQKKPKIDRAKLLPMLVGPGDRHSECQRYDACLTRAAAINAEAHCPIACSQYSRTPREHYLLKAILVPRVSYETNAQGGRLS